jgi:hypothetical protein
MHHPAAIAARDRFATLLDEEGIALSQTPLLNSG